MKTKAIIISKSQTTIIAKEGQYLQSYNKVIIFRPYNKTKHIELDMIYWNRSTTTGKHRNAFLGETISETRKKIASGEYILTELN